MHIDILILIILNAIAGQLLTITIGFSATGALVMLLLIIFCYTTQPKVSEKTGYVFI